MKKDVIRANLEKIRNGYDRDISVQIAIRKRNGHFFYELVSAHYIQEIGQEEIKSEDNEFNNYIG